MRSAPERFRWRCTGAAEGDLGIGAGPGVEARRRAVVDRPWSWLRQVHGADVVGVTEPGGAAGAEGDALVSARADVALAVFTADCAPLALASPEGVIAAVHAGWRGLASGVVERSVTAMRELGASDVVAVLGPCIHAECYEFSDADLAPLVDRFGPTVAARSSGGAPALDVPAAVRVALDHVGVPLVAVEDECTACSGRHYSHRARAETERQATVVWWA